MATPVASLDGLCVNVLRGLAMDAVQKANSGHPGLPLGAAAMAYSLWDRHLRHSPANPAWANRDRFILSAGHGCALLYGLLHLTGYDLSLDDLKAFRQWGSKTPGHPENTHTAGVEMATGPLGQGLSTAVGMAVAERFLAARFNRPGHSVIDHFTYVLCSDGDLMEGVTNEAGSLAGHWGLGKLIALYDDNGITIDGSTARAFTEDSRARYRALGWQVLEADGLDIDSVDRALQEAKADASRPTLIACRTTIGYGSPNRAGTAKVHGAPLGPDEVKQTKLALGLPPEEDFYIPSDALGHFRQAVARGQQAEAEDAARMAAYAAAYPEEAALLKAVLSGDFGTAWVEALPSFGKDDSTRKAGQAVLEAIAPHLPTLIGGSADLAESTFNFLEHDADFQKDSPAGRNLNYGIREHAMMAIVNGITLHGGLRAHGGTFLTFSDYCRPALRLAALMECPSIAIFTHDSIGLGEDGPTHQPVEHFMALRAIPNFNLFRPADANETSVGWKVALQSTKTPTLLALSRQKLPLVTPADVRNHPAERGGYVLKEASGAPRLVLVASGSEVSLALSAASALEEGGIPTRVVSLPSWFLFEQQTAAYREDVLPRAVPTVSVEAGVTLGWSRYAQAHVGLDRFGASAPGPVAMERLGFTVENVVAAARGLLG